MIYLTHKYYILLMQIYKYKTFLKVIKIFLFILQLINLIYQRNMNTHANPLGKYKSKIIIISYLFLGLERYVNQYNGNIGFICPCVHVL